MIFYIYYSIDGNSDVLKNNDGTPTAFVDTTTAFNAAKQIARSNPNAIISVVDKENGSIIIDFQ